MQINGKYRQSGQIQKYKNKIIKIDLFFKKYLFLFIWLHRILVVACKLLVAACGI